jgi:hypothetical protein
VRLQRPQGDGGDSGAAKLRLGTEQEEAAMLQGLGGGARCSARTAFRRWDGTAGRLTAALAKGMGGSNGRQWWSELCSYEN